LLVSVRQRIVKMNSLRFFEVGLGCVFGAVLNFMFGYWINVVLLVVGLLALVFGFLESRKVETKA
jgi:uncharacterized membrane protein (Fun14 family)